MKLHRYLETRKMTRREFAKLSGIPLSSVYRLLDEAVNPNATTIAKIIRATQGAVTPFDFVNGQRSREKKAARKEGR